MLTPEAPAPLGRMSVNHEPGASSESQAQAPGRWSQWFFFRSDKALEWRVSRVSQEGATAVLRYQFRINSQSPMHCGAPNCDGYYLNVYNSDADRETMEAEHHLFFPNSFTGVYDYPNPVRINFRNSGGFHSSWNEERSVPVYSIASTGEDGMLELLEGCVDYKMAGSTENRCSRDLDLSRLQTVR